MIFSIQMESDMKELYKSSRNLKNKKEYKVTNCKEYEQSLCNRDFLNLRISPTFIKSWNHVQSRKDADRNIYQKDSLKSYYFLGSYFTYPQTKRKPCYLNIPNDETQDQSPRLHNSVSKRKNYKTKDKRSTNEQPTSPSYSRQHRFRYPR